MTDSNVPMFASWLLGGALVPGLIVTFVIAYLFGSIPFGLFLTRAAGLGDIATSVRAISGRPMCCAPAIKA